MTSPDEPDAADETTGQRAVDLEAIEADLATIEARLADLDDPPVQGGP